MDLEKRYNTIGSNFVWTTQFNDLKERNPTIESTISDLKISYLFHDKSIIRDADIVNHPILVKALLDNPFLFGDGALVPALRDSVGNFTELNELAGCNRAFPEKYKESAPLLSEFDRKLHSMSQVTNSSLIASLPSKIETDHFDVLVKRIIDNSSTMHCLKTDLISDAREHALSIGDGEFLSFGKMYDKLVSNKFVSYSSREIQCLRLAHNMVVPIETGISANISDNRIVKEWVDIMQPRKEQECDMQNSCSFDFDKLSSLYPRVIPIEDNLTNLTFDEIKGIRRIEGRNSGYFVALDKLQKGFSSGESIFPLIEEYLSCLSEYLERIDMVSTKVTFVNWKNEVEHYFDSEIRSLESGAMKYGIPYAYRFSAGVAGFGLCTLIPDIHIWQALGAALALNATPVGAFAADHHKDKSKKRLDKINKFKNMVTEDFKCRAKDSF